MKIPLVKKYEDNSSYGGGDDELRARSRSSRAEAPGGPAAALRGAAEAGRDREHQEKSGPEELAVFLLSSFCYLVL